MSAIRQTGTDDRTDALVDCLMRVCDLIEAGAASREQLKPLAGFLFDELEQVIVARRAAETVSTTAVH